MGDEFAAGFGDDDLFFELDALAAVSASNEGFHAEHHSRLEGAVDSPVIPRGGEVDLGVLVTLTNAMEQTGVVPVLLGRRHPAFEGQLFDGDARF